MSATSTLELGAVAHTAGQTPVCSRCVPTQPNPTQPNPTQPNPPLPPPLPSSPSPTTHTTPPPPPPPHHHLRSHFGSRLDQVAQFWVNFYASFRGRHVVAWRTHWRRRQAAGATSALVASTRAADGRDGPGRGLSSLLRNFPAVAEGEEGGRPRRVRSPTVTEDGQDSWVAPRRARGAGGAGEFRGAFAPGHWWCSFARGW